MGRRDGALSGAAHRPRSSPAHSEGGGGGGEAVWLDDVLRLRLLGLFSACPAVVFTVSAYIFSAADDPAPSVMRIVFAIVGALFLVSGGISAAASFAEGGPPLMPLRLNKFLLRIFMMVLGAALAVGTAVAGAGVVTRVDAYLEPAPGEEEDPEGVTAFGVSAFFLAAAAPLGLVLLVSSWYHLYLLEVFCQSDMPEPERSGRATRAMLMLFAWGVVLYNAFVLGCICYIFVRLRGQCEKPEGCAPLAALFLFPFAVLIPLSAAVLLGASYLHHLSRHGVRHLIAGPRPGGGGGGELESLQLARGGTGVYDDEEEDEEDEELFANVVHV